MPMPIFISKLFLFLFVILVVISANKINYESESQALDTFSQGVAQKATFTPLEVERALDRNYWALLKTMILDYYNLQHIDLFPTFTKYKKKLKKENFSAFESLVGLLPLESPSLQKIGPAFLWAQNMTFLFVKIKFSQKLDTPGNNIHVPFSFKNHRSLGSSEYEYIISV